ncbi:bifunctional metallophosphatase/5'-nucleotidase [Thalassorhabdus alkalitolerans]|uniref:Bifunctional metallophosphatase/5'-nucleotidase n=1 Tax=Thalassorhabdus alkalitolerans TaxID=2282697 RepID=A0ABW0YLF7_9BACI
MADYPIYIYHTNDLHSHLSQWPLAAGFLNHQDKYHKTRKETALFFDIGDHADRVHPITEGTKGKGNVRLLNKTPIHHVTIGNNEGITFSKEDLDHLYDDADFNVLAANLFEKDGSRPSWAKPYDFITVENDTVIGIIGVTVPFYPFYDQLGWQIKDPETLLPSLVSEVKQKADIIILLSHLGYHNDEKIAREHKDIDVILGAHTHNLLKTAQNINGTLVAQCGKHGYYAGQIRLLVDEETKRVKHKEGGAIEVSHHPMCEETQVLMEELQIESSKVMETPIVELKQPLEISWTEPSQFADMLATGVREWCGTELAMINSGLLLESLSPGVITRRELHRLCPHPINPCIVKVKGAVLKETIHAAFTEKMIHLPLKGFGFRGEMLGRMAFSGMEVHTTPGSNGQTRVDGIYINGKAIELQEYYSVATADMFTFGPLYPGLSQAEYKEYFMPELMRDILAKTLKDYA